MHNDYNKIMPSGYFVDIRHKLLKRGSYYELCLKNENVYEIARTNIPFIFWIDPNEKKTEYVEGIGLPFNKVEKYTPLGRMKLYEFYLENPYQRPEVLEKIKEIRHASRTIGFKRNLESDYKLRYFHPYSFLTVDEEIVATTAPYSFAPTIMTFDIETDNSGNIFPVPGDDRSIILISACYQGATSLFSIHYGGEKQMLEEFFHFTLSCDPDFVIGWNSDKYDWPYIEARCKKLKIKPNIGRDGSELKVDVTFHTAFGRQFIDAMRFVPLVYHLPNKGQDDATRIIVGKEPMFIDKARIGQYAKTRDSKIREEIEEYSRRDSSELFEICKNTGMGKALVNISKTLYIFPEMLTRRKPDDILYEYTQRLSFHSGGVLFNPTNFFVRSKKQEAAKAEMGIHRGFRINKRYLYPLIIKKLEPDIKSNRKLPVVWAAETIKKKIESHKTSDPFSSDSTIVNFMKELGRSLPHMFSNRKYEWRSPRLSALVNKEAEKYMIGFYDDCTDAFAEEIPENVGGIPSSVLDAERVDKILVLGDGKYIYMKDGMLYVNGLKLWDKSNYVTQALRDIAATLVNEQYDKALKKLKDYCKEYNMEKILLEPARRKVRKKREKTGQLYIKEFMDASPNVSKIYSPERYFRKVLSEKTKTLIEKSSELFGLSKTALMHEIFENPNQLQLEFVRQNDHSITHP